MDIATFYTTASSLCFTLLGLWWAVVQFRHEEWMSSQDHRRMAYAVSLHFLLPGIMCLLALVISESPFLWRATFTIAGASGILAMVFIVLSTKAASEQFRLARFGQFVGLPIYILITVFALIPGLHTTLGITLAPLQLEAIFLSLLVLLGASVAWLLFAEPKKS